MLCKAQSKFQKNLNPICSLYAYIFRLKKLLQAHEVFQIRVDISEESGGISLIPLYSVDPL